MKFDLTKIAKNTQKGPAFLIDNLILIFVYFTIHGALVEGFPIGVNVNVLLCFLTGALYFGFGDSHWFNGQTLGKKIFKIKVVDKSGKPLGVFKAFVRYTALFGVYFLGQLALPQFYQSINVVYAVGIIGFIYSTFIQYFAIFNGGKRNLHDFFTGTLVIQKEAQDFQVDPLRKKHMIWGSLIVLTIGSLYFGMFIYFSDTFDTMMKTSIVLNKEPDVVAVNLAATRLPFQKEGYSSYNVAVIQNEIPKDPMEKAFDYYKIIKATTPDMNSDGQILMISIQKPGLYFSLPFRTGRHFSGRITDWENSQSEHWKHFK